MEITEKELIRELRKDLKNFISKYTHSKEYLENYEHLTGISITKRLNSNQLNDLINWCVNSQLAKEREQKEELKGVLR